MEMNSLLFEKLLDRRKHEQVTADSEVGSGITCKLFSLRAFVFSLIASLLGLLRKLKVSSLQQWRGKKMSLHTPTSKSFVQWSVYTSWDVTVLLMSHRDTYSLSVGIFLVTSIQINNSTMFCCKFWFWKQGPPSGKLQKHKVISSKYW